MAEAHSAVAFSFTVTPDGVDVNLNHEAIRAVWQSGLRSWKKRYARVRNNFYNGVYPASPASWLFTVTIILGMVLAKFDPSLGWIQFIETHIPGINSFGQPTSLYASCVLFATIAWFIVTFTIRYTLKLLLTYQAWMFAPRGKMSLKTKLWLVCVKILKGRNPALYSYQGSLPKLPVPSIKDTMNRYLRSVEPLMSEEKYKRMEKLVDEFKRGIGPKLQRYLVLKSWWATNYVSDWWEEYVYLRGRSPIMVNSNFYGLDSVFTHPTRIQAARAANVVHSMLLFRREVDRNEIKPLMVNKTIPLCSWQYERQFNTTRVPGIETDTLVHYKDSRHIVVYNRGRYYKVYIHYKSRLLKPCELEIMFQKILDDEDTQPAPGEEHLAALTAGDRIPWAKARMEHFSKGINKTSLEAIEKAAFVVALDESEEEYDPNDPSKLDRFAAAMLHGKGYDRWFDKSFTFVVLKNGRVGFNGEHS